MASPRALAIPLFFGLVLAFRCVYAANWAEVSGDTQTNAAILEPSPWAKRHGHAITSLDFSDAYVASTGKKARLFLIGGDSSIQGMQDLRAYPGGGNLKNDVWATTGITWNTQTNILKTTKWGDPLPQIVANVTWLQTNSGKRPPKGVTYQEWTACAFAAWSVATVSGCDDPTTPPGSYLSDNMFSPRRNFVALAFQNELFVLGGRAREHFPVPEAQLRGGATIGPRNARWREFAVLKNDVWKSSDAGASWSIVTPGCLMPQKSLVHKAGSSQFQCDTDDQCDGDSSCEFDETTSTGFCVCNMWSPREFHAVAVHSDNLYLSGGYAQVQLGNCGVEENARKRPSGEEFACGGGYRAYMNDVWMSTDGQHWKLLVLHASFSPRGEHAMVSFKSMLYIFGGRSGDSMSSTDRTLLNDIWLSSTGSMWSQQTAAAPWSLRSKHVVVVLPGSTDQTSGEDMEDELLLMYGEDEERPLGDVWTWKGGTTDWILDFSPGTDAADYVTPLSDVRYLRGMVEEHATELNAVGINTITDLTTISFDLTIQLRAQMPVCDYIALATQLVTACTVTASQYPGQEYANVQIIQGANGEELAAAAAAEAAASTEWNGCSHVGTQVTDSRTGRLIWPDVKGIDQVQVLRDVFDDAQATICKWTPSARTGHSGVVFQRKVFVAGGLTAPDYYQNDFWYRDKRRPKAQFTLVPTSGTSETVFKFESDKPGCIFEYHVLDVVEMLVVRNWTKSLGEVDFESWLYSGKFQFRVRALDPAGNVDMAFEDDRNQYTWRYVPKLPWALIIGLSSAALVVLAGLFMEWRKRRKRAAMERYAMKRMRRKLKGAKKAGDKGEGDANWRETYDNAKDKKGKKPKKGKLVGVKGTKAESTSKEQKKAEKKSSSSKEKAKDKLTSKQKDKKKNDKTKGKASKKSEKKSEKKGESKKKKTETKDTKSKTKSTKTAKTNSSKKKEKVSAEKKKKK